MGFPLWRRAVESVSVHPADSSSVRPAEPEDKDGGGEVSVKEFDRAMRAAEKLPSKKEKHDAGLGLDEVAGRMDEVCDLRVCFEGRMR